MAVNHINYNPQTASGQTIQAINRGCRTLVDTLQNHVNVEGNKIDGDGSDPLHFTAMVAEGTFDTEAEAKSSYDQMNSLLSQLNTASNPNALTGVMSQVADFHGQT